MAVKVLFCYAREDEILLNKLKSHLRPLQRQGLINVWYDHEITAGAEWEAEIKEQLNQAEIILLLISSDFMDSDYCYSIEMKRALERHKRGEAKVIPIILRHVYWQGEPLDKLQALPKDGLPCTDPDWHNLDRAFYSVTEGIRKAVEGLNPVLNHIPDADDTPKRDHIQIESPSNSGSIPTPEGMIWLEELTVEKPFTYKWPEEVDTFNKAWKGAISLQGKRFSIKVGENIRHQRGRLIVFFNQNPICEFAETLDHKGWSSLIKPDGKKMLMVNDTPPALYQKTRIESYRDVTGISRAPNRAGVVILKGDLPSAIHHAAARWLANNGFPVK